MGAIAQLRDARTALREERKRTIAERDAFARFLHRVDAVEAGNPQAPSTTYTQFSDSSGSTAINGPHQNQHGQQLRKVHDTYRETVMAVEHYEEEYDESLAENLAAEFGDDVATAVCETAQLTPPIRQALLERGQQAYHERIQLLDTLDDEDEQLVAGREQLTDLGRACEQVEREIIDQPSGQLSFPEVYEAWHRLGDLEAECAQFLADRQHFVHETGAFGTLDATAFYDYLYGALGVTYPILTAGTALYDRLQGAKRRTAEELTRHA